MTVMLSNSSHIEQKLESLLILIQVTDSFVLAFVHYRTVTERQEAIAILENHLSLPVKQLRLSAEENNPILLLRQIDPTPRVCVCFYNIEEALPDLAGYVNLQREKFAEFPHAVVFCVRESGLREIAIKSPDFWAWRSGVFDIRSEETEHFINITHIALSEPLVLLNPEEINQRILQYQQRLQSFREASTNRLATDQMVKLGMLLGLAVNTFVPIIIETTAGRTLGTNMAQKVLQQALEANQKLKDSRLEAAALHSLGILAHEKGQLDQAEEYYSKALTLREQTNNATGRSAVLHQLGNLALDRKQPEQAEALYHQSLGISEQLQLGIYTAATCHQLGNLAFEQKQFEMAENHYNRALTIYGSLGMEYRVADEYHQLGNIGFARQKLEIAETWYTKAMEIYQRLGLLPDVAREAQQLSRIAYERGHPQAAHEWTRQAAEALEQFENYRIEASKMVDKEK